jgi:hypothetical protein
MVHQGINEEVRYCARTTTLKGGYLSLTTTSIFFPAPHRLIESVSNRQATVDSLVKCLWSNGARSNPEVDDPTGGRGVGIEGRCRETR